MEEVFSGLREVPTAKGDVLSEVHAWIARIGRTGSRGGSLKSSASSATAPCRLCGGTADYQFERQVLGRHQAAYYRCRACLSLETEEPYWLDSAYEDGRRFFDTGAVERNLRLQATTWSLIRLFGLNARASVLDWGGGDGLFVRLLRDVGVDAYHYDRYATNSYAAGFEDLPERSYDLITAFEVWEHLPEPAVEIEQIFTRQPEVHFLSTSLYTSQGSEWPYLWPTTGRHVFFYSPEAMHWVAERYGYEVSSVGDLTVFYRDAISRLKRARLELLLSGRFRRYRRALFNWRRKTSLASADRAHNLRERH